MNVYDENVMLQTRVNYLQQRLNDAKQEVRDLEGYGGDRRAATSQWFGLRERQTSPDRPRAGPSSSRSSTTCLHINRCVLGALDAPAPHVLPSLSLHPQPPFRDRRYTAMRPSGREQRI